MPLLKKSRMTKLNRQYFETKEICGILFGKKNRKYKIDPKSDYIQVVNCRTEFYLNLGFDGKILKRLEMGLPLSVSEKNRSSFAKGISMPISNRFVKPRHLPTTTNMTVIKYF